MSLMMRAREASFRSRRKKFFILYIYIKVSKSKRSCRVMSVCKAPLLRCCNCNASARISTLKINREFSYTTVCVVYCLILGCRWIPIWICQHVHGVRSVWRSNGLLILLYVVVLCVLILLCFSPRCQTCGYGMEWSRAESERMFIYIQIEFMASNSLPRARSKKTREDANTHTHTRRNQRSTTSDSSKR